MIEFIISLYCVPTHSLMLDYKTILGSYSMVEVYDNESAYIHRTSGLHNILNQCIEFQKLNMRYYIRVYGVCIHYITKGLYYRKLLYVTRHEKIGLIYTKNLTTFLDFEVSQLCD